MSRKKRISGQTVQENIIAKLSKTQNQHYTDQSGQRGIISQTTFLRRDLFGTYWSDKIP